LGSIQINRRTYRWPQRPLVVACLDGCSFEYIREAAAAGVTPYLTSLITKGNLRLVNAAMPTFTNPNNLSIVTGVSPALHGISGNFYLERDSMKATTMNDPSLLRAESILSAFSRAGGKVAVITAKDKLRRLLSHQLRGVCFSAEQEGQPIYSAALSEYALRRGVELMRSQRPDLMYLSTSDYVQHMHPPGFPEANNFYQAIDREFAELDRLDANLVITADHGMNAKTDCNGQPRVIFLQSLLDHWFGVRSTTVILPITDPYVAHHGSLGSFASIYHEQQIGTAEITGCLKTAAGVELVLGREAASTLLELPADRIGDVIVCADSKTVLGKRPRDHDLSLLRHPLRSHGGLAEREVPMLFNRPISPGEELRQLKNYDAFWIGLNALSEE
jgi:phosphonoacetate hydrolase